MKDRIKEIEQIIIDALNSESLFCERCDDFNDGKYCNECNKKLLKEYKQLLLNNDNNNELSKKRLSNDELWERAKQSGPLTKEELGIR